MYKATVLLLVWIMVPGVIELTLDLTHIALWGHSPHDESEVHHEQGLGDEHGCSGPFHACVCHSSSQMVVADELASGPLDEAVALEPPRLDRPAPSRYLERLFRPPRV